MRASIRAAVATYLTNAEIPYVGTVFPARPVIINEEDYENSMVAGLLQYVVSTQGSAGVIIVNISESARRRQTLTGYGGAVDDVDVHQVELELFFANTAGDAAALQADHDTTVDKIVVAIRADPTLGTAGNQGAIFGAGVFDAPVSVHQGAPYTGPDGLTVFIPSVIRFEAWEWIAGQGV